ncbi:DUF1129 domain-containing protein [Gulosibacter molinativorax]|uniref:Alcohol dehydrogenase n=1 Tax=Gulosibacter molinativorax TaxID=256821 RepID=A0ABT7C5V8_9MICO|nr:hypothetical protein [Gulosibacter molinativorax]MDJ1370554.1 hypothetical protein [Gulosibacter molinativorax]QUY62033.1 Hypotetical protein [Gulosibacter molinativorax]
MARNVESVLTFLAYLVFGVLAGTVGTFAHRGRIALFDTAWWIGLPLALIAIGCVAFGLRYYLDERMPGLAFAIGVAGVVAMFTTSGAGASVVLPASQNGFGVSEIWMYGSAILVFVPVLWPRIRTPEKRQSADSRATRG